MEHAAALNLEHPRAAAAWKKYVEMKRAKHEEDRLQALELIREARRNGEYDPVSDPPVPLPPLELLYKRKNIPMPDWFFLNKELGIAQRQMMNKKKKKLES